MDIINILSIGSIFVLRKKLPIVIPLAFAYSVIDSLILLKNKNEANCRKTNQLIIHHAATIGKMVVINKLDLFKEYAPKIFEIELSTLLILLSKRIKVLKGLSKLSWVYYRVFYVPFFINQQCSKANDQIRKRVSYKIGFYSMHTIEALGLVWTLETFKVPQKYLRPCCVSNIPIISKCIQEKRNLLLSIIIITSVLHHSNHNIGSITHTIDKTNAYAFTAHVGFIAYDKRLYCKYVSWVTLCYLVTLKFKTTHEDSNRDYDNIIPLVPHVVMHCIASEGTLVSVFEKNKLIKTY
uniref:Uncharacterized protein n=1 Tax=viral metagenome TaxID=1070528 RepID=A0A6C0I8B9_9ZZZZ